MSQPPSVPSATYEFDEFRFEPRDVRLVRRGVVLHAEPKAMKVLEVLLRSSGSLVERDTLLEQVWGRVIVTPGTLTRLIAELRRLLGDDPLKPRFIETVDTKGYRWIAPVAQVGELTLRRSAPPERSIELIGRDEDLTQLELIAATSRPVTLAGPEARERHSWHLSSPAVVKVNSPIQSSGSISLGPMMSARCRD